MHIHVICHSKEKIVFEKLKDILYLYSEMYKLIVIN